MNKEIFRGAEAVISKTDFLRLKSIKKSRKPKNYRNKILDERIRNKRFLQEIRMNHRLKLIGIRTPIIYFTDEKNNEIIMEEIKGKSLQKIKNSRRKKAFLRKLGNAVGLMHSNDLIHGDLTLNNVLAGKKDLYIIDLGLGFESGKLEEKSVDFLNLKKELNDEELKELINGYKTFKGYKEVLEQVKEIENRARYMNH